MLRKIKEHNTYNIKIDKPSLSLLPVCIVRCIVQCINFHTACFLKHNNKCRKKNPQDDHMILDGKVIIINLDKDDESESESESNLLMC